MESCPTKQAGRHVCDKLDHAESCIPEATACPINENNHGQERQDGGDTRREKGGKKNKNMSKAPLKMPMEAPRIERGTVCRMQGQCKTEIIPLDHTPRACGNGDQRLCPRLVGLSDFRCAVLPAMRAPKAGWWGSMWCLLPGSAQASGLQAVNPGSFDSCNDLASLATAHFHSRLLESPVAFAAERIYFKCPKFLWLLFLTLLPDCPVEYRPPAWRHSTWTLIQPSQSWVGSRVPVGNDRWRTSSHRSRR